MRCSVFIMETTPNEVIALDEAFSTEIRAEMARQNITQQAAAEYLKMHHNTFSLHYHGRVTFSVSEAIQIADFLNKTLDDLVKEALELSSKEVTT